MISYFSSYIRGIIFFLVFASFIGIILPNGKYKSYINIVLGFIVVFMVFEPVSGLNKSLRLDELIYSFDAQISKAAMENSGGVYEAKRVELIISQFEEQMQEQIKRLVEPMGYSVDSLSADIDVSTGILNGIELFVREGSGSEIKVKPVKIGKTAKEPTADSEKIKNIISDFYNLDGTHIYVSVQPKG